MHRFKNRVFNASTPPLQGVAKGCYRFPVYIFYESRLSLSGKLALGDIAFPYTFSMKKWPLNFGDVAPLMELISTVSSTRRRLVDDGPSRCRVASILGANTGSTLVSFPTRRSDDRSPRSRKDVGRSPAGARHIWAKVARQTTRKVPRGGAWGSRTAAPVASTVAAMSVDPVVVQSEELQRIDKGGRLRLTAGGDGLLYPLVGISTAPFVLFDVRSVPSGCKC